MPNLWTLSYAILLSTGAQAAPLLPDLHQWQLKNGLQVIYFADHKAPVVTVQVIYHVGAKDEPADKRGMAHMFEHMMFKGSTHVAPEQHARFIDSVGGLENAFTADDLTLYYDTIPPAALDFTLKLEAERMRNLLLIQKTIDSEREVVKEELRVRLENSPIAKAREKVLELAYSKHPYRVSPIGNKKMLDTVTPADCQKFYDAHYRPSEALLIVAGDVDETSVRTLVDANFSALENGPVASEPKATPEPPQEKLREATITLPVQLPIVIGAYHIPEGSSDDMYPLEVLQQVLTSGESSRLYQRLVRRDKLAVAAGGFVVDHEQPGTFMTYAVFLPSSDVSKVKLALAEEIARMSAEPVDAHELEKAKNQLAAKAVFQRERVSTIATQIGVDAIIAHDPLHTLKAPARYDAITAAEVQRVAQRYLVDSNFSQVTLNPAKASKASGGGR